MQFRPDLPVRCYLFSLKSLRRAFGLVDALFSGFWLGVLKRSDLEQLDATYYQGQGMYHDDDYNRSGLRAWEREAVERYFGSARNLLVTAAGGGREALALLRMGYRVDAFECNPGLAACANRLLAAEGFAAPVLVAERDGCPELEGPYDGVIVGWGAFMLTEGRGRRVRFLRELRALMTPGAPVLLSFYVRDGSERRFRTILAAGNFFRRLLRREPLELGDDLSPNYVHYCERGEIERTLAEAGFDLAFFGTEDYGHAVGIARPLGVSHERATPATACGLP